MEQSRALGTWSREQLGKGAGSYLLVAPCNSVDKAGRASPLAADEAELCRDMTRQIFEHGRSLGRRLWDRRPGFGWVRTEGHCVKKWVGCLAAYSGCCIDIPGWLCFVGHQGRVRQTMPFQWTCSCSRYMAGEPAATKAHLGKERAAAASGRAISYESRRTMVCDGAALFAPRGRYGGKAAGTALGLEHRVRTLWQARGDWGSLIRRRTRGDSIGGGQQQVAGPERTLRQVRQTKAPAGSSGHFRAVEQLHGRGPHACGPCRKSKRTASAGAGALLHSGDAGRCRRLDKGTRGTVH